MNRDRVGCFRTLLLNVWLTLVGCATGTSSPDAAVESDGSSGPTDTSSPDAAVESDGPKADLGDPLAGKPCNPLTGLSRPLPACSSETPCTRVASELGRTKIVDPGDAPVCDRPLWSERLEDDVLGFKRYACVYRPAGASARSPRPLLLFFHGGGGGSADGAVARTRLPQKARAFDLSGTGQTGFIFASVHGRFLRHPTGEARDGRHHDFYYRDLRMPSTNPDIAYADHLIDRLVQEGSVDRARIYLTGWSNGAFFSQLYAIARHETATSGGNRVAAAAVFAAADPFAHVSWDPFRETPTQAAESCALDPYPRSRVPILLVHRSCDLAVACEATQAACFPFNPGYQTEAWIARARALGLDITPLRLAGLELGAALDGDAAACTTIALCMRGGCEQDPQGLNCLCRLNHGLWPDGDYPDGPIGRDREPDILAFLRRHSYP